MAMNAPAGVTADTLAAVAAALASPGAVTASDALLAKTATTQGISTTTGLVGYLLEAPAKNLFPVLSPLRNRFARHGAPVGATAVNWKAITAINAAKVKAGVAEGVRNTGVSTSEIDRTQTFKDFGLDDLVTFRAIDAGRGFEDVRAMSTANLLSAVMVEEEKILLGGNVTALGAVAFVDAGISDVGAATPAGPFTASTQYDFAVTALTSYGYLNGAAGHVTADAADETAGQTLVATHSLAGSRTSVILSWTAKRGAVAYNVYAGAHSGTMYYLGTVTATKCTIVTTAGSTAATFVAATNGQALICDALPTAPTGVPNTADQTADALSFDGVIPQIEAAAGNGYWKDALGLTLTGDNAGGIVEIDTMLQYLYDHSRIGPTVALVNSAQGKDMLAKVAANGTTTTLRLTAAVDASGVIRGGLKLGSYLNKFTGQDMDIMTHPYMAPGTIVALSERLPFPNNNVPNPFEVEVLREYTQYDWAMVQRRYEFGVYGTEALKCYFPAGCGVITGLNAG